MSSRSLFNFMISYFKVMCMVQRDTNTEMLNLQNKTGFIPPILGLNRGCKTGSLSDVYISVLWYGKMCVFDDLF